MNLPISLLKLLNPRIRHPTSTSRELAREITMEGKHSDSIIYVYDQIANITNTEATPATMSTRSYLLALPPELHLEIFRHLHPVSSTCLGLTCKEFYPIHKKLHGVVRLRDRIAIYLPRSRSLGSTRLGALLNRWAGPEYHFFGWSSVRFTKRPNAGKESKKESENGEEK